MGKDEVSTTDLLIAIHENAMVSRNILTGIETLIRGVAARRDDDYKSIDIKTCISIVSAAFTVIILITYFVNDRVTEVILSSNQRIERLEAYVDSSGRDVQKLRLEREFESEE